MIAPLIALSIGVFASARPVDAGAAETATAPVKKREATTTPAPKARPAKAPASKTQSTAPRGATKTGSQAGTEPRRGHANRPSKAAPAVAPNAAPRSSQKPVNKSAPRAEPKSAEPAPGTPADQVNAEAPPTLRQLQARACSSKAGNARVVCHQRERFRFCRGKYGQHADCPAQAVKP